MSLDLFKHDNITETLRPAVLPDDNQPYVEQSGNTDEHKNMCDMTIPEFDRSAELTHNT